MTYVSKNDYYEIKLASLVTNVDKDVLVELYQPLVGSQATILYLTLLKEKRNETESHYYQVDKLLRTMQLPASELLSARRLLEAVGLLRTYESIQDDVRTYVYVLYAPKSPKSFFDDVLFKGLLIQYVGEKEAKALANKYKLDLDIAEDYKEISASFVDVFKPDYDDPAFKKDLGNGILGREHGREKIEFNYDLFFSYISENSTIEPSSLKKRDMKEIERLASLFGLDEKQMAFIVIDEYRHDEQNHFDFKSIKNRCEDEIRFSGTIETHKSKISGDSAIAKKVQMMEEVAPAKFLSYLQKNTKPARTDINTIDSLSKNYGFNNGIINVIIDYVLTKNNNILSKNYCESIASTLARNDIHTTVDAMNCLNSIVLKNNKGKSKKIETKESPKAEKKVELNDIYDFIDELEVMKNGKWWNEENRFKRIYWY